MRIAEQVVSGGVWDWDIPSDTVYWSDGYQRLCDYPLDEAPSRQKWMESLHPEIAIAWLDNSMSSYVRRLHNWSMEYRIRTAYRSHPLGLQPRAGLLRCPGKPKRMVGINVDITARRFAQDAARESELRMHLG